VQGRTSGVATHCVLVEGTSETVRWIHGPHGPLDYSRLPRERRHEPFSPRLPQLLLNYPALAGVVLASTGIFGTWLVADRLATWPDWTLFPAAIGAILCLLAMVIGLGIIVVRALEPVIGLMDLNWDAEPTSAMGIPLSLQRKCEALGFWTAEELAQAIDRGAFPWRELAYDERMQIERAVHRWKVAVAAEAAARKSGRRGLRLAFRRIERGPENGT
jgi:hypothetical protein